MSSRSQFYFALMAVLVFAGSLGATNIFIGNNSFEPVSTTTGATTGYYGSSSPLGGIACVGGSQGCWTDNSIVNAGGPSTYAMAGLTDWTVKFSGSAAITTASRFGLWAPTTAVSTVVMNSTGIAGSGAVATHGGNVAYSTTSSTTGTIDITQVLGTTFGLSNYTLKVDVGWRSDRGVTPSYQLILAKTSDGGATFTTLGTETFGLVQGIWHQGVINYSTTAFDVGTSPYLILRNNTAAAGGMVVFDNALLSEEASVPEPATMGLMGGALLALGYFARKRAARS